MIKTRPPSTSALLVGRDGGTFVLTLPSPAPHVFVRPVPLLLARFYDPTGQFAVVQAPTRTYWRTTRADALTVIYEER